MSSDIQVVLLPGLDGTGRLFARFLARAPAGTSVSAIPFPEDRILSYDELAEHSRALLPHGRLLLVGESFSGPLALRLATRVDAAGVVLCASFIRAARSLRLAGRPLSALLGATPPASVVKALMSGGDEQLARELVAALGSVAPKVVAARIRMVLAADTRADLTRVQAPILYLRARRDRLVAARQADLARQTRPDVRLAELDGPHLLLQARASEAWESILSFSARLS